MVFIGLMCVFTLVIAFFHYIQGLFSATISAILVIIAAMVAMAYHEWAANFLLTTGFAPYAISIALTAIFAIVYIIPKIIIDSLVPGNVRYPVLMDKIGAAAMGLLAGLFATGIVAIAAEALPFGPVFGMYSRYAVADVPGRFMSTRGSYDDTTSNDVLQVDTLDPDKAQHLWFHQDDLVNGMFKLVSAGSLSDTLPFAANHPDYIDELYGQRLGIQVGAKTLMVGDDLSVDRIFTQSKLAQVDGEEADLRGPGYQAPPSVLQPAPGQTLVIIRTKIKSDKDNNDSDAVLRISSGAIRLLAGSNGVYQDYHPVATMDPSRVAVVCKPDDFIVMDGAANHTIDLVFLVDSDVALQGDATALQFTPGSFLQIKRYGFVDLSGKAVEKELPPNDDTKAIMRKPQVQTMIGAAKPFRPESASGGSVAEAPSGQLATGTAVGLTFKNLKVSSALLFPIDVKTGNTDGQVSLSNVGVTGDFAARKWAHLTVTAQATRQDLSGSVDEQIANIAVPDGQVMVQASFGGPTEGEVWDWGKQINDFQLIDTVGHAYKLVGAWALVRKSTQQMLAASIDSSNAGNVPAIDQQTGRPSNVYLAFYVPSGTTIAEVRYEKTTVASSLNFSAQ
ncbi:MAG: hypothetical protein ABSG31_05570 [Tepidisphaeraceae bacterium]|jgi:hypothetical protein